MWYSRYLPRACGCISSFPNKALGSGVLISVQPDCMPYVFKLEFDLHALTLGWFSSLFTTDLSSKNRDRNYLVRFFSSWNWDNNPHHHSLQEPCLSCTLKYWVQSARKSANFRCRIVFQWFAPSPAAHVKTLTRAKRLEGSSVSM